MKDYLEYNRKLYREHQGILSDDNKLGDILPSVVKTHDEIKVEFTKDLTLKSTWQNLLHFGGENSEDEDEQLTTGGGVSNYSSRNKILPVRFVSSIDSSKQSANVPGMILQFVVATKKYEKLAEIQPFMEATRDVANSLQVLERGTKMGRVFSAVQRSMGNKKLVDKTNLAKTVDYIIDTFVYGQTKNESKIGKYDMQKVSTNIKKLSSFGLFTFNIRSAVRNTFAAHITSLINTNITKGFFGHRDYEWATLESIRHTQDYIKDYKKFGDKTFIGQAMQYFSVLHGVNYNAYGQKTQWTVAKAAPDQLSVFKNASEFQLQVAQFLAMSRANKVIVDGQTKDFLEAYELGPEGNFQLKSNASVTKEQEKELINKISWINRQINGAYRAEEKNAAQKTVLGDLAFYLNGYFMTTFKNMYSNSRYAPDADIVTRGYWNQTAGFISELFKYKAGVSNTWSTLNQDEKGRVIRFAKQIGYVVALSLATAALGGNDDKKKLKHNSAFQNMMLATIMSVSSEIESFVPLPSMGLNEISRKINSPFAALKQITNIIKMLQNGFYFVTGNDKGFYKVRGNGHEKGDAKVVANFLRMLGYSGAQFDPLQTVINTRANQTLR